MTLFDVPARSIFPTSLDEIMQRIQNVNPVKYASTRNYINGAVTYLSPYISRGVVSTKYILQQTLDKGYHPAKIEKFIQELAWRDYWQQIWIAKGDEINKDLKRQQYPVANHSIPEAIVNASTGIDAIDNAIKRFYETGYMHNHVRMYVASLACNVSQSHWLLPAKWMYYHLLDADWASNALSWQWVAGANANKKYIANQDNINKYCFSDQKNTFLDISYEALAQIAIPAPLKETPMLELKTPLPELADVVMDENLPLCVYNFYNIDPSWKNEMSANRILLLEPSHFDQYPVSKKTIDFIIKLAKDNIPNVQVFVGEFKDLSKEFDQKIHYKEHPTTRHYKGIETPREWMFTVEGHYPSFFSFWKKCKKELNY